ncbi:5'-(N(7)-methylguanosine 5'-triphospho)-[mRNA] hydrolase [Malassezia psittaci]|uniref:5'-(N(7)-methylguanosine 5'-triphospho)-[mRNA] hydrolase n=1 Tax=Malassezia psittaci TaxID=1821823 RepID=A0AAF0JCK1_9BASI|nr:5'-(N(7)-methylguanosine 5'-triphospho)-[mRNA] hydrolase [Malassezia psittaci]
MAKSKAAPPAEASAKSKALQDELENLSCRFIVNLPANELASIERIGFQVEQAHWFYLDFLCPVNSDLPELGLKRFSEEILHVSSLVVPLIRLYMERGPKSLELAFSQFMQYKTRVPVCGAILLNHDWTKVGLSSLTQCVLVKGWAKSASWTFPKGKINQDEPERDCALREVYEETGIDASKLLPPDSRDYFDLTMREQKVRLYIVPGLSEDTPMETQTRREISRIEWFSLSSLPTGKKPQKPSPEMGGKFYLITPFITRLRQWIQANKRTHPQRPSRSHTPQPAGAANPDTETVEYQSSDGPPAAQSAQVPGLIALPLSAQKKMQASRPQTPSSPASGKRHVKGGNKSTPRSAAKTPASVSSISTPVPEPAPSAKKPEKSLLDLLHGSEPVPIPKADSDQDRQDGSTALKNLLGLKSESMQNANQPWNAAPAFAQDEQSMHALAARNVGTAPSINPHIMNEWLGAGIHHAQGPWSMAHGVNENAPGTVHQPSHTNDQQNHLLQLLSGTGSSQLSKQGQHDQVLSVQQPSHASEELQRPGLPMQPTSSVHAPFQPRGLSNSQPSVYQATPATSSPHTAPSLPTSTPSIHHAPMHHLPHMHTFSHGVQSPGMWQAAPAPSRSTPTGSYASPVQEQSHQHALLSTLLSPTRSSASSMHPTPWDSHPTNANVGHPSPWPGYRPNDMPNAMSPPANHQTNSLLSIMNGGQLGNSSPQQRPLSGAHPNSQEPTNPLLATLLGK